MSICDFDVVVVGLQNNATTIGSNILSKKLGI
jgi:hypothetical protein